MKLGGWKTIGAAFVVMVVAACVNDAEGDQQDQTRVTVASSGSGEPIVCDTGEAGAFDVNAAPCGPCAQCAIQARCADETARCPAWATGTANDPEIPCDVFQGCLSACFDVADANGNGVIEGSEGAAFDACTGVPNAPAAGTCIGDNPNGWDDYIGLLSCIICQECEANCDGQNSCS
jgi:hypothetical protein